MRPLTLLPLLLLLGACGAKDAIVSDDVLASVGTETLSDKELRAAMPSGMTHDDSIAFAKAYIRSWIDTRLIERVAAAEVDMEQIDRLTREYRDELIMSQYRRAMSRQVPDGEFSEDSLRAYYDSHIDNFKLERPLVKGVYIKVPEDAPNLSQIRRLYRSDKAGDADRLEKAVIGTAIHYDYFRDTWIDWEQIEKRVPVDFSRHTPADIAKAKHLETESQGFVYLLYISDYLPEGTAMPYEAARSLVRERILNMRRRAYDSRLLNDLYQRAIDDGTLKVKM